MIPDEIKKLRMDLGLTQEKFARLLDSSVGTINRWETGVFKPSRMSLKELKIIQNGAKNESNLHQCE